MSACIDLDALILNETVFDIHTKKKRCKLSKQLIPILIAVSGNIKQHKSF